MTADFISAVFIYFKLRLVLIMSWSVSLGALLKRTESFRDICCFNLIYYSIKNNRRRENLRFFYLD
jgi:hypothetical protein